MSYTLPTVADFKSEFSRDFPYSTTSEGVMDSDITKALKLASFNINESLFITQAEFTQAYLYLAAHYLVTTLNAAMSGTSGAYTWMTASKSVDALAESYTIPEFLKNDKLLSMLSTTTYGAMYISLIAPRLIAGVWTTHRDSLP